VIKNCVPLAEPGASMSYAKEYRIMSQIAYSELALPKSSFHESLASRVD
jgi:hypothetical protein